MNKQLATIDDEADDFGLAMRACLPKERAFVLALLEGKSGASAARQAGYGAEDGSSTAETFARIAHRTLNRSRVIDALAEQSRKTIRSLAPSAIQAVKDILTTTNHKDRAKVALNVIERVDPIVQKTEVTVTHTVDHDGEAVAHLRMLKSLNVARERLEEVFGFSGLSRYEKLLALEDAKSKPPIVDAEFTVVDADIDAAIAKEMSEL
jgi:phage terminase small subunit